MYRMFVDLATVQGIWTMHNPECLLHDQDIQKLKQVHVAKPIGPGHNSPSLISTDLPAAWRIDIKGTPSRMTKPWSYATEPLEDAYPCGLVVKYHEHDDHGGWEVIIGWPCDDVDAIGEWGRRIVDAWRSEDSSTTHHCFETYNNQKRTTAPAVDMVSIDVRASGGQQVSRNFTHGVTTQDICPYAPRSSFVARVRRGLQSFRDERRRLASCIGEGILEVVKGHNTTIDRPSWMRCNTEWLRV